MDDRGIIRTFHLCARIFEFLVQTRKCSNRVHVPHFVLRFLTFKVGKTQIQKSLLITLERGIMSTIKMRKKGGSFHFEAVPLKSKMYPNSCRKKVYLENGD